MDDKKVDPLATVGLREKRLKTHLNETTSLTNPDPLKADFRNFLYVVWKHLNLPDPTPVQYDAAHFLQNGPRRLVIEAFRGVGKSWVTSAYVCWLLYCDPLHKVLVVSASKIRADDFSTFTLRLIHEMDLLKHLRPKEGQRQSKVAFDVGPAKADHAPSVKSVGITGQLAGSRADTIVADDIEVPNNSATQVMRDKLSEAVKEFDAILKPGGRIIYLGTPQCEQSIYNTLPERGYVVRIWPARFPNETVRAKYGTALAPFIADQLDRDPELVGQPTDPDRFDDVDLTEREMSYGRSGFALQFMLDTSLSDADRYPLKLADLIIMSLNPDKAPVDIIWGTSPDLVINDLPNVGLGGDRFHRPMQITSDDWVPYNGAMMAIDPSGRGKDETAYVVIKELHGRLHVTAMGGFRGGYDSDTLQKLLSIAKTQKVNLIQVEPNFGDGMFAQLLRSKAMEMYPVEIEDAEWARTQKEARIIDTLEPVMNQHRLVLCPSVIEQDYRSTEGYGPEEVNRYRLIYQMTRLTREKGAIVADDRIDALAMAVAYWVEIMNQNADQALETHKESLLNQELERFMEHSIGKSLSGPSFLDAR